MRATSSREISAKTVPIFSCLSYLTLSNKVSKPTLILRHGPRLLTSTARATLAPRVQRDGQARPPADRELLAASRVRGDLAHAKCPQQLLGEAPQL